MAEAQQRMPWAPPAKRGPDLALPTEIWGGYCSHHQLVGFWQEKPGMAEMLAYAAVELKKIGAQQVQRDIGRMCQRHPELFTTRTVREDRMGVVKGGEQIDPAPEGTFRAVCIDNYTVNDVDTKYGKKDVEQFVFEIEELNPKNENKPYLVFKRSTSSIGPKSHLTAFLEAWRGKKFTKEDRKDGFDCEKVVGACCQVQIIHNHKDNGDVFANIQSIMPLGKGMEKLQPSGNYKRKKDRDTSSAQAKPADDPDDDLPF